MILCEKVFLCLLGLFTLAPHLVLASKSPVDKPTSKCVEVFGGTAPVEFKPSKFENSMLTELNPVFPNGIPLKETEILDRVSHGEDLFLVDLNKLRNNYKELQSAFPNFKIYAATKAVKIPGMLEILIEENSYFEIATIEEFRQLRGLNVDPKKIMFTHPDKDALEISESFKGGVSFYVSDSLEDLQILAKHAPGSKLLIRVFPFTDPNAVEAFERFGVDVDMAMKLVKKAKQLGLKPKGVTFHVGTQTENFQAWKQPIEKAASLFKQAREQEGIELSILDIGGGFPAIYKQEIHSFKKFGEFINQVVNSAFEGNIPKTLILEPGRGLSGMAAATVGRIISVKPDIFAAAKLTEKLDIADSNYPLSVTSSIGKFSAGLYNYGIHFMFYSRQSEGVYTSLRKENCVFGNLYGKACTSIDSLNGSDKLKIPANIKSGDIMVVLGTGAYSMSMCTPDFCSKASPTSIIFDSKNFSK